MNIASRIRYDGPKVESTQMSSDRRVDKRNRVHPRRGIVLRQEKGGILTLATTWGDLKNIVVRKTPDTKGHRVGDARYMNRPQKGNP